MLDREPDKLCDWPAGGCGEPVWFQPTAGGRQQVVDADGGDHHGTCAPFLAMVAEAKDQRDREREQAAAAEREVRPTLF